MSKVNQAMTDYLATFVEELVQAGVKEAVISPGSRSTPLALLMAEHPTLKVYVDIDERSAGFFALGIAKAAKRPVVLLCTSGTAAANYFPAIAEAKLSTIPLIVLTADRPPELRNVGAPQAIEQINLYGTHVKTFVDMALPENSVEMLRYAKWHGSKSVDIAMTVPRGPVHLNFPLREPLVPVLDPSPFSNQTLAEHVHIYYSHKIISIQTIDKIIAACSGKKGIIVAGPLDKKAFPAKLAAFAKQIGWPIIADPLSGLRSYGETENTVIDQYDAFLRTPDLVENLVPEVIIRFGAMPVSKSLMKWLEAFEGIPYYLVDPGEEWKDPMKAATDLIHCDEHFLVEEFSQRFTTKTDASWLTNWQDINQVTKKIILMNLDTTDGINEGALIALLRENLPDQSGLFIGNSMPIRDVDTFFAKTDKKVKLMANRGANGIDGVISSALGGATVQQSMFLVIGDLSFYHDMNGLLMAQKYGINLTIVLVNNNGGGIFSFLPQANLPKYFETLFGTELNLDFGKVADLYSANYHEVTEWEQLYDALDHVSFNKGLNIIEIRTNRYENLEAHKALFAKVAAGLTGLNQ
ncbi:2-succinyl-5-enolpyruvyl-6-hydroxy-3-cyclohexene-1-carboxylic-acid synthase [Carnobacterium gallinarum]|uniref:2-succinyl-5-enolpyruvyl-6-hydroxy-3- cyclohexene-1-carboxylic-acid synthase n=1 Tax=Carnobacterium gallinarum TaxID=2749 RepID=UPI0005541721|nr:2-succinyl-5-enolpyruvyl-6-hydroxy-3-cyclohexene-1-carboxylic-acid synthase [Carnobacterium gallinarum]